MFAPDQSRQQARTRGRKWKRIRDKQLQDHPLCQHCIDKGFVTAAAEVDHVLPLFKGGTDAPANLQSLCSPCHEIKTRADLGLRACGCDVFGSPIEPERARFK